MSKHSQFSLLATRRFLPLFFTQFLGAFNDNVFKNALVILITFVAAEEMGVNPQLLVTIVFGIFILPFFLFSATAGQVADKHEKSKVIQLIKLIEVAIMLCATLGFILDNTILLIIALFFMAGQSTLFGPLKYSILPDHLTEDELIGGNALIEAGTFLSILLGTIVGATLILTEHGRWIISCMVVAIAILGFFSSLFIPKTKKASPNLRLNPNIVKETWDIISFSTKRRDVFLSILGISWFWLIGTTFLSQLPVYVKDVIGGNEEIITLFLAIFSIGIALGSLFCNKLLKSEIHATYVPLAAFLISIFTVDLYSQSLEIVQHTEALIGINHFLSDPTTPRILFDLFMIAVSGGIYTVPLYAILQARSDESHRSRTIASNNILNALFMVIAAIGTIGLLALDFSVTQVFLTIAILNGFVALYICKLLPDALVRSIFRVALKLCYRVELHDIKNYLEAKDNCVIVANHTSFLDAMLIATFINCKPTFAVDYQLSKKWWMKPFLMLVDSFPVDPTNPMSTKSLIACIKVGKRVVIFPEGRLTVTGSLMKVYEGPAMIADKAGASILPVRIDGAQYTPFSRLKGKVRIKWFPKITMTFLKAEQFVIPENIKGRKRRQISGTMLYDVMTKMVFESSQCQKHLFRSLLDARKIHGRHHVIIEDVNRNPLNYNQLITRSLILGKKIAKTTLPGEHVGILLPNMSSTIVTFFACLATKRVPAMLNYSTGLQNVISACDTAKIKQVYTAKQFIKVAKLESLIAAIQGKNIHVVYLEDLAKQINMFDKMFGFIKSKFIDFCRYNVSSDTPAVVLFTSGSEGLPKGVILSHTNLQANRLQLASCIDFGPTDIVLNVLPVFHSFGLTGGTILPVLSGIRTFFYPSPLHYRIVSGVSYEINATILFGTDTFLTGYAKFAHPYDFYSLRYVFSGAEKLKPQTCQTWSHRFGVRIFEGYGATETSPVIATNTPMHNKPETVGRLLPGINYRLEPVPGIEEGGKLVVSGPNIMKGYLLSDAPGEIKPPAQGWYDTGDIVSFDNEGYITIKGRVKRFAKIAGEMVSLTAVETFLSKLWPQNHHAVIAIPDPKKGEQLVLVTTNTTATRQPIAQFVKKQGLSELYIPKNIIIVEKLPLLGTGKTDYVKIKELVVMSFGPT